MKTIEQITENDVRRFFEARPYIAMNRIEKDLGMPRNTISKFLRREPSRKIPEDKLEQLSEIMYKYGYGREHNV